jgi:hypothetical protein
MLLKFIKQIELEFATLQLFDPPLVRLEMFGNVLISAKEAKVMNDLIGVLSEGKEIPVLMIADEITQFDASARDFSASEEGTRYTVADAMVVKNIAQRLLASFYLSFNKPKKPSKMFSSEEEAIKWLYSIAEKNKYYSSSIKVPFSCLYSPREFL